MFDCSGPSTLPLATYNAGLGLSFTSGDYEQIAQFVTTTDPSRLMTLLTCNLDHISLIQTDEAFKQAYRAAWAVTVDSRPLWIYIWLRGGRSVPSHVTGADLLPRIVGRLRPGAHRIFVIAPSNRTGTQFSNQLAAAGFARDAVDYMAPPLAFERDDRLDAEMMARIKRFRPTHLFVGLGAPKSELWLLRHGCDLDPMYAFCFGAALQYQAGEKARAPLWMQRSGLEWAWRFGSEPRRLGPRYGRSAAVFLQLVCLDVRSLFRRDRRSVMF